MKAKKTWIVVADGAVARIYVLVEDAALKLINGGELHAPASSGQDVFSDRPGRTFDSARQGRHAMEPSTQAQDQGRLAFVREIVDWLEAPKRHKEFQRLVLIAAPKMLGELRAQISTPTRRRVVGELDKDLTKAKPGEILEAAKAIIHL